MGISRKNNRTKLTKKVEKYEAEGLSRKQAIEKAEGKMENEIMTEFLGKYGELLKYILQLRFGPVHKQIIEDVNNFIEEGFNDNQAVKMCFKKNRHILEGMFEADDNEQEEE